MTDHRDKRKCVTTRRFLTALGQRVEIAVRPAGKADRARAVVIASA